MGSLTSSCRAASSEAQQKQEKKEKGTKEERTTKATQATALKLLFLDVDGVLNDNSLAERIGEQYMKELRHIVNSTGCRIVLSTTWKNYPTIGIISRVTTSCTPSKLSLAPHRQSPGLYRKSCNNILTCPGGRHRTDAAHPNPLGARSNRTRVCDCPHLNWMQRA